MEDIKKHYRHIARVIIETTTPFSIGSGNKTIKTDSAVLKDVNGFPFIPGTTIAGLIRHALSYKQEVIMGGQEEGSLLIVTEGKMLDSNGNVLDGIIQQGDIDENTKKFKQCPIRQHARIGHRGTTEEGGKFDEEIALKGTRFCFELELISDSSDNVKLKEILNIIRSSSFRIGSGSRSGFGSIKVVSCKYKTINLQNEKDREWYLEKSSSLAQDWEGDNYDVTALYDSNWTSYCLELQPSDFILFGSGLGNENADMTFVRESYIDWPEGKACIKERENNILVPASSVKGAISHRVAFHYNKLVGIYADQLPTDEFAKHVGDNNLAVRTLFGTEGRNGEQKQRGCVLMSDVIQERSSSSHKVLNHVAIDRFTGGAIDGALFDEEILYAKEEKTITLNFLVSNKAIEVEAIKKAFEYTLNDICLGMLPLGGGVNRGNGCFTGKTYKNGELIYG